MRVCNPQPPGVRTGAGNSVGFWTVERAAAWDKPRSVIVSILLGNTPSRCALT